MSAKVKWPCKFPDRWTVLPSKRLFPESKDRAPESDEQLSATQEYGVISQAEFMRLAGRRVVQLNQNLELRKRVEIGDFVISMRSFQGGLERAWAGGGIRSSYVVLRPRADLVPGYYQRLFKSVDYIQALQSTANFIRDGQDMNYQNFVLIDLPFPPVSEQFCIAAFLDHETARIDALIEEQQRLIELLKEKRQAVISHAVTKGLDPTVPMKDSGVEWLGEVPAHWVVCATRRAIRFIEQGWSPECESYPAEEDGWGVLKAGCVNRGFFDASENKTLPSTLTPIPEYEVRAGDILMSRASGSPELVGSTALLGQVRERLMLSDKIFRIHLEEKVSSQFFVWVMNAQFMRSQIEQALSGGNGLANNLPQSSLLAFWLAIPPEHEQGAIAGLINEQTGRIDELIVEGDVAVELLQERRSALISAAVTGKIDVRGWQPPASARTPELVEEAV
ncbi:restriction endonuclease subunit S [Pseudomonas sp. 13B_2.1_Bac1]|uniref:restriction endonuclease subunit S n=1 Tax=Pseudomonas sp. 13B_2.1_Bac1 TaxID=2971624 RepID=UPI0021C58B5B|nr:restriction endonuclease subunit S [Pseudomonas sp. 13B_2.1_Bac1]MCU1785986.1 restriction endonuclease subunit S [Pseudomonas sp. 13B_2.1_Bac1]